MELIYKIGIIGIVILGVGHAALTFKNYKKLEENAFWFFSAGLALIFNGLINYMNMVIKSLFTFKIAVTANILLLIFAIILAYNVRKITMLLVVISALTLLISSLLCPSY